MGRRPRPVVEMVFHYCLFFIKFIFKLQQLFPQIHIKKCTALVLQYFYYIEELSITCYFQRKRINISFSANFFNFL